MVISRNSKIGILVTATILLFIWGFNFLKGNDLLKSERNYFAVYNHIDGLVKASPVMISGYKVGQVRSIRFMPDNSGKVLVNFVIENKFEIRKNSIAQIYSTDIMGTKALKIILGTQNEYQIEGDTLQSSVEVSLVDQVNKQLAPLKTQAEHLVISMDSALSTFQIIFNAKTQESLNSSFANLNLTIRNLEHATSIVDTLVISEKSKLSRIFTNIETLSSALKNNTAPLNAIMNNFANLSDSLAKSKIKNTIYTAELALIKANNILNKINKGEGSLGLLVNNDTLYNNLQSASSNLNLLLKDIKEKPKKYVHFSALEFGKEKAAKPTKKKSK